MHTLHSTTPVAEQREVFQPAPDGVQRIILATNIAETSVTIPGTTVVVDSGRAKLKIYDPSRHVSALVTSWAGSANLDQRAGRAGRERPGDYYAVFGTRRLQTLRPHQVVEMLRLDLSEVVMHVKGESQSGTRATVVTYMTIIQLSTLEWSRMYYSRRLSPLRKSEWRPRYRCCVCLVRWIVARMSCLWVKSCCKCLATPGWVNCSCSGPSSNVSRRKFCERRPL